MRNSHLLKLVNYDDQLLVVDFEPQKRLNVYKIDFASMVFVKLETLGKLALFYGWTRCYVLRATQASGDMPTTVYYVTGSNDG